MFALAKPSENKGASQNTCMKNLDQIRTLFWKWAGHNYNQYIPNTEEQTKRHSKENLCCGKSICGHLSNSDSTMWNLLFLRLCQWCGPKCTAEGGSLSMLHTVSTICCRLEQEAKLGLQRLDRADDNHVYRKTDGGRKQTIKRERSAWVELEGQINGMPFHKVTWKYFCSFNLVSRVFGT